MKTFIFLLSLSLCQLSWACEPHMDDSAHPYVRVAAGWTGRFDGNDEFWEGRDELAASFDIGVYWNLTQNWKLDARIEHHSQWFITDETSIEFANVGFRYEW